MEIRRTIDRKTAIKLIDSKCDEFRALLIELNRRSDLKLNTHPLTTSLELLASTVNLLVFLREGRKIDPLGLQDKKLDAEFASFVLRYQVLYDATLSMIVRITSQEDASEFERKINEEHDRRTRILTESGDPPWIPQFITRLTSSKRLSSDAERLLERIEACERELKEYRIVINTTLLDDLEDSHLEVIMGHKVHIGDFADISGSIQILVGDYNRMVSGLEDTGKTELAQALQTLITAILTSKDLPENQKQDHIAVITQVGEEAKKSQPNKTLLKMLSDGLLGALKTIPDIAQAVTAVAPVFSQLHL